MRIFPDNKIFYSIGNVAKMVGTTVPTIRVWEKEFDIIKPKKNRKGDRFFTVEDIENLKLIKYLLKEKGYKMEGARKILRDEYKAAKNKMQVLEQLKLTRDFLESLKTAIDQRGKHKAEEYAKLRAQSGITTDEVDLREI